MKRLSKQIAKLTIVLLLSGVAFASCNDAGDEIFEEVELQEQSAIDDEDEKVKSPLSAK